MKMDRNEQHVFAPVSTPTIQPRLTNSGSSLALLFVPSSIMIVVEFWTKRTYSHVFHTVIILLAMQLQSLLTLRPPRNYLPKTLFSIGRTIR